MEKIVALVLEDSEKICQAYNWPLDSQLLVCQRGFYISYIREVHYLIRIPDNLGEAIYNTFSKVIIE